MPILPTEVDLPAIAQHLLVLAGAALGANAPVRQYRAAGYAVQDLAACDGCDAQLTVSVTGSSPGTGAAGVGQISRSANYLRQYTFTVELARSVPVVGQDGGAPPVAVLDGSALQHLEDYRTLDVWIRQLGFANKVRPDLQALGVMSVAPGGLSTVGPSGGVVAIRAVVTVSV